MAGVGSTFKADTSQSIIPDGWEVDQSSTPQAQSPLSGGGFVSRMGRRLGEVGQDIMNIPTNAKDLITGGGQGRLAAGSHLLGGTLGVVPRTLLSPLGAAAENASVRGLGLSEDTGKIIGDFSEMAGGLGLGVLGGAGYLTGIPGKVASMVSGSPASKDEQISNMVSKATGLPQGFGGAMNDAVSQLYKAGEARVPGIEPHSFLTAAQDAVGQIERSGAVSASTKNSLTGKNGLLTNMIDKYTYMASNGKQGSPSYWNREIEQLQRTIRDFGKGTNPDTNAMSLLQTVRQKMLDVLDKTAPEFKQANALSNKKQYADQLYEIAYSGKGARDQAAKLLQTDAGASEAFGIYSTADKEAFLKQLNAAATATDPRSRLGALGQIVGKMGQWEGRYLIGRFLFDLARGR